VAKVSGLTTSVTIAGNDISNDVTNLTMSTPYGEQDITGLDKSAIERLLLRADLQITLNGVFNTAANKSHATFKTPGSKTVVIVFPGPATMTATCNSTDYQLTMGTDGSLTWSVPLNLNSGTAGAWS
jgi:hypothetical protein